MSKSLVYLTVIVTIVGASIGGYYVVTHTQVRRSEVPLPAPPKSDEVVTAPAPKPDHGNFEQRFQPKAPPPNGRKVN